MDALKSLNLALRFALEVGALAAVGYWGWKTADGGMRWVLAAGAVIAVIVVWTFSVSPNPRLHCRPAVFRNPLRRQQPSSPNSEISMSANPRWR
jgi:membrane protein YdbS with pleckstrin-like domain